MDVMGNVHTTIQYGPLCRLHFFQVITVRPYKSDCIGEDWRFKRAGMRLERADLRVRSVISKPERTDLRPERAKLSPERL